MPVKWLSNADKSRSADALARLSSERPGCRLVIGAPRSYGDHSAVELERDWNLVGVYELSGDATNEDVPQTAT